MITGYEIKKENMQRLADYSDKLFSVPQLKYLFLELTDKCNLCCKHCGSGCNNRKNSYLKIIAMKKVLDEVADRYNPKSVLICLTGGEPLLHKDVYKVINYARSLGFVVGMTTNGTLIDVGTALSLARAGLNTVAVSIDGVSETHDGFRCVKGAFGKAIEGCLSLNRVGFDVQVTTVVSKYNISELDKIYELLKEKGITSWFITNVDPVGRAKEGGAMLLDGAELRQMFQFIKAKRYDPECTMEVSYGCAHYAGLEFEREVRDFYFQCGAGVEVAGIAANGEIRACLDIERREELCQGNIYEDDFLDVWENRFQQFRRNRCLLSCKCMECTEAKYCRGDSAHTWNYDTNEPNYCVFKLMERGKNNE